jgi:hypothetical protein
MVHNMRLKLFPLNLRPSTYWSTRCHLIRNTFTITLKSLKVREHQLFYLITPYF